jgi:tRNA nucleotidyltransferase (CCA-adding enzyme)
MSTESAYQPHQLSKETVNQPESLSLPEDFPALFRERGNEELAKAYELVISIAAEVQAEGGSVLLVGGFVRDFVMGALPKDMDIEVYGMDADALEALVNRFGKVSEVGKSFGILKLFTDEGIDLDISVPRTDSKVSEGHRGFAVKTDPNMGVEDAARRRDFTMNAMAANPLTGEIIDPFGGLEDIRERKLVITDPDLFADDPLRVLRAMQFCGRFDLKPDPESAEVMKGMASQLKELPKERIFEEYKKLLLKSPRPSKGLEVGMDLGVFKELYPLFEKLRETPQDPKWHPEGNVWVHTLMVVDEAAKIVREQALDDEAALMIMLSTLCHDLGKITTTTFEDGHVKAHGHEQAGERPTQEFLDSIGMAGSGNASRNKILQLVREHMMPGQLFRTQEAGSRPVSDGSIRRLATRIAPATIEELVSVAEADHRGRGPFLQDSGELEMPGPSESGPWLLERAQVIGAEAGKPADVLMGRDLIDLGYKPGKYFGRIIELSNLLRDNAEWSRERILDVLDELPPEDSVIGLEMLANKYIQPEEQG